MKAGLFFAWDGVRVRGGPASGYGMTSILLGMTGWRDKMRQNGKKVRK